MPTVANPKAKTKQLVAKPKPEWETEFVAFKEICARNSLSMSQEIYERAIKSFLRDHHWPPGNSQTLLEGYVEVHEVSRPVCEVCGKVAVFRCETTFLVNPTKNLCRTHVAAGERRAEIVKKVIIK